MTTKDKDVGIPASQAALARGDDDATQPGPATVKRGPGRPRKEEVQAGPAVSDELREAINQAVAAATKPPPAEPEKAAVKIPKNLFSGYTAHLDVFAPDGRLITEAYPDFRFRWWLDEGAGQRIANARLSGWEMVNRNDVLVNDDVLSGGNTDPGANVRVTYGMWSNGKGKDHYLMRKPKWLADIHDNEREKTHQNQEAQLQAGAFGQDAADKRYTAVSNPWAPNSASNLPPIRLNQNRSS